MAYDRSVIIAGIHKRLGACPRSSLAMICKEMGVGRHTAQRALRHGASHPGGGGIFRDLQREFTHRGALALLASDPPLTVKEVASRLGFTDVAGLRRFTKSHFGVCPRELRRLICSRRLSNCSQPNVLK